MAMTLRLSFKNKNLKLSENLFDSSTLKGIRLMRA